MLLFLMCFAGFYVLILAFFTTHVRLKTTVESLPRFEPRNPASMPASVFESFRERVPRMEAEGFETIGYFYNAGKASNVETYLAFLKNVAAGDTACVAEMHAKCNNTITTVSVSGFATDLPDGLCVNTTDSSLPSSFKHDPTNPIYKFPDVQDFSLLYKAHRRLLERHAPGGRGVFPSEGMEAVHLSTSWTREVSHQADFGYYYLDESENVYRPTWKGAFIGTAKLLWPTKIIVMAALKVRADLTLKSLNLN